MCIIGPQIFPLPILVWFPPANQYAMKMERQKSIIYIAVGIIVIIIIVFYIQNFDFIMNGGLAGAPRADKTWEVFKTDLNKTFSGVKNQIENVKNSATSSGEKDARFLQILKDKVNKEAASGTTSTIK